MSTYPVRTGTVGDNVLEFNAGANRVIATLAIGLRNGWRRRGWSKAFFTRHTAASVSWEKAPSRNSTRRLTNMRHLHMKKIYQPQGLLVHRAGNIIVVESRALLIDVFPPGTWTPSVTVSVLQGSIGSQGWPCRRAGGPYGFLP